MAGPLLTPNTDANPWVEVFFDPADLNADTASLRIYRLSEDRTWLVRGGVDIAPGVAALDFETPFQIESSYRAEQFDAFGVSLGYTELSTITLDVTGTWVHQPLQPLLAAQVRILSGSASSLARPTPGDLVYTQGAAVGRRIGPRRRGLTEVPVSLLAETLDAADTLQAMLGSYVTQQVPVLCIRTSAGIRWPRTFFASTDELEEIERNVRIGGELVQFDAAMDEVAPPFPGLVVPLLSYDDLDAFGNYTAQDSGWATYTDRDRAYELAGLANQ